MALPLEETIAWHRFATIVNGQQIGKLDEQFKCLEPLIPDLRANAAKRWHRLLYSSLFGSYLGEKPGNDAFEAIMHILAQRAAHGYKPPAKVMWRMQNREALFPCVQPSPNATVYDNWVRMQQHGWAYAHGLAANATHLKQVHS